MGCPKRPQNADHAAHICCIAQHMLCILRRVPSANLNKCALTQVGNGPYFLTSETQFTAHHSPQSLSGSRPCSPYLKKASSNHSQDLQQRNPQHCGHQAQKAMEKIGTQPCPQDTPDLGDKTLHFAQRCSAARP